MGRSQGERERERERGGGQKGSIDWKKSVLHRRKVETEANIENLLRGRKESMIGRVDPKALQEVLVTFGFNSSLAKLEMEKEVGRRRARS